MGTERNTAAGPTTFSEDISVSGGDLIQIYSYHASVGEWVEVTNFRLYYDKVVTATDNTVILN